MQGCERVLIVWLRSRGFVGEKHRKEELWEEGGGVGSRDGRGEGGGINSP